MTLGGSKSTLGTKITHLLAAATVVNVTKAPHPGTKKDPPDAKGAYALAGTSADRQLPAGDRFEDGFTVGQLEGLRDPDGLSSDNHFNQISSKMFRPATPTKPKIRIPLL